jgi:threonylcarbamoyladenosine tRNA methylthiotransferase MtaB
LPGKPSLGVLVQKILAQVPSLERLRLSSIDSIEADEALFDAIASEQRLMPHFHLSLQHGDDMILKRMKRRHLREHSIEFCRTVRDLRPDASFGADIIAGFPTETEAMFENALSIIDDCGLARVHAFPFSPREGTPAAKMPQLDRALIKDRAARLRAKAVSAWQQHLEKFNGTVQTVLFEKDGIGRTQDFTPVSIEGSPARAGAIATVQILNNDGERLIGCHEAPVAAQ